MVAKYKTIMQYLQENYIDNSSSSKKLPSEPQLSQELGVSRFPINRAISELVAKQKVTRLSGVGTFVKGFEPESYRQKMQLKRGVIIISFMGTVNTELFHGIQSVLLAKKIQFANLFGKGNDDKHMTYDSKSFRAMVNTESYGLLIIPPLEFGKDEQLSLKRLFRNIDVEACPTVVVERPCRNYNGSQVIVDNAGGTAMVVEAMLKMGHKKIAYLGKDDYMVGEERAKGYFRALSENGMSVDDDLLAFDRSGKNFLSDIEQFISDNMDRILKKNPDCEAFMTFGVSMAQQVYAYLKKRNLFHDNIKIGGYDRSSFQQNEFLQSYISLHRPFYQIGKDSASTLLDVMNTKTNTGIFVKKILPQMFVPTEDLIMATDAYL